MSETFTKHNRATTITDSHEYALTSEDASEASHEAAHHEVSQVELSEKQLPEKRPELVKLLMTEADSEPLRPGEQPPKRSVEQAHTAVEQRVTPKLETGAEKTQLNPLQRLEAEAKATQESQTKPGLNISDELANITVRREIKLLQRRLPKPQRVLSRLIHQPIIRTTSEIAGQTVSRPSGLLGGSLVAFLGTTGYLYLAKHDGFTYNYLVFLILFVGGFIIGLGLELAVHLASAGRRPPRQ
jgi:hypothetical protein